MQVNLALMTNAAIRLHFIPEGYAGQMTLCVVRRCRLLEFHHLIIHRLEPIRDPAC